MAISYYITTEKNHLSVKDIALKLNRDISRYRCNWRASEARETNWVNMWALWLYIVAM